MNKKYYNSWDQYWLILGRYEYEDEDEPLSLLWAEDEVAYEEVLYDKKNRISKTDIYLEKPLKVKRVFYAL